MLKQLYRNTSMLEKLCSILQTEAWAVLLMLQWFKEHKIAGAKIRVDSQAVIKVVCDTYRKNSLIKKIRDLTQLSKIHHQYPVG